LDQLGVTADDTWMVGDNDEWEVIAPQRLGVKGIWIDHKGGLGRPRPPPNQRLLRLKEQLDDRYKGYTDAATIVQKVLNDPYQGDLFEDTESA
jgi:FMN phosphatase YigB (HAD superfamily)